MRRRLLALALAALLAVPVAGQEIVVASLDPEALARVAPRPRPAPACSADGAFCIAAASYDADVCRAMEAAATRNALDPHFFARLIWRESLFDAGAVSPAGAEGIAQFMPETARLRGLRDSFNPAEALAASAAYLADLSRAYGNIGLAAVAYNGGEARAERFIARDGGLAPETRAYVQAITGHSAETWRDAAPEKVDLTLTGDGGFQGACLTLAATRSIREFPAGGAPLKPWGVVIASNRAREGVERQADRLKNRYAGLLAGEEFSFSRNRRPGMPRMHVAQVGRDSRAEANALCGRLRAAGADCMVLSN